MKELYDKVNNKEVGMKPVVYEEGYLGKLGGYLNESDVIKTLIRYCLSDLECGKYQIVKHKKLRLVQNINCERHIVLTCKRIHVEQLVNVVTL